MRRAKIRPIVFLGDSLDRLREFPAGARAAAGVQLHRVQLWLDPGDWKPMSSVGPGVREIRIREDDGAFRVLYVTRFEDAIYVLHAFQKRTERTTKHDLTLASDRLRSI